LNRQREPSTVVAGPWHAGVVQASAFDTVASSIVVTLKIHRYLLVKRGLLPSYKIVSVIFVLPLLIGFLFRDADLHPPYNEIACSEFQDFRENVLKRSERWLFRTYIGPRSNAVNLT
jgi:hypothetical protein